MALSNNICRAVGEAEYSRRIQAPRRNGLNSQADRNSVFINYYISRLKRIEQIGKNTNPNPEED